VRIVIVGAGLVGISLTERLLQEGHDISIVELNEEHCKKVANKFDVLVVNGSGSNPRILSEAGVKTADIMLAVTPEDEVNIIACSVAMQYGVDRRIARIRCLDYISPPSGIDLKNFGISQYIDPENAVVDEINQYISTPGAIEAMAFEKGKILIREFKISKQMPITGKTLMEIRSMVEEHLILVMTILRDQKAIIPSGDVVVMENDEILVLFPDTAKSKFLEILATPGNKPKKIILSGDNLTTFKLAQSLDKRSVDVIWITPDFQYGKWAAGHLDKVEILYGDSSEIDLLKDIHVERAGFFVGSGKNTEHNVLSALLAKSQGVRETIAISDQPPRSNELFKSIGIDHVINPRLTTASSILDYVHYERILSEIRIRSLDLEGVRILAGKNSRVVGLPLHKAWKPLAQKAIVGAIIRDNRIIIPEGNSVILPQDHVFVIFRSKVKEQVKKMFRER